MVWAVSTLAGGPRRGSDREPEGNDVAIDAGVAAVLAIDIGSSSVRAAVLTANTEIVCGTLHRVSHTVRYAVDGTGDLDPDGLVDAVVAVIDGAVAGARRAGVTITAAASDSMWHSVCGVDDRERTTFPILTWADRRAATVAPALRDRLDDLAQHRRTGARLHSVYWPAKLLWLATEQPEALRATRRLLSPGELVHLRLFGETRCSVSMASGTGLFDQHALRWDQTVLGAVPVDLRGLSELSEEPLQGLRTPWNRRWPELSAIPWFPTWGDGATSSVGAGCLDGSSLALTVGTTSALRLVRQADAITVPADLWCYRVDPARYLLGGALNDGGNLAAWMHRVLRLPPADELARQLISRVPGEHGLTLLPMWAGERGPGWSDTATGTITGLSHATDPVDIFHAAVEGVALLLARLARSIHTAAPGDRRVVATGAAMSSPAWRQIIADALGRPVVPAVTAEASLRGTAMLALERLGVDSPVDQRLEPGELDGAVVQPRPDHHDRYVELMDRQNRLYCSVAAQDD